MIVEVFPRYFPLSRACRPRMGDPALLDEALAAFGSEPLLVSPDGEDEGDAIVTAAALRALGEGPLTDPLPDETSWEGWIFGVPITDAS